MPTLAPPMMPSLAQEPTRSAAEMPTSATPVSASGFVVEVPQVLLQRARAGDRAAFEQIYRRFERPVHALAQRLLGRAGSGGGDRDAAADVLQDTMFKVYRKLHEFRGDGAPFWSWVRQIAVNEALDRLRRQRRDAHHLAFDDGPDIEDDGPLPPAAADAARLQRALAALPDATRSVLWLYHAEGYTHEEIASLMQRSPSFSKSQLARGIRRLRTLLETSDEARDAF